MRTSILFASLLLLSLSSFCQQAFTLKISLPATFPINKLSVSYSDGLTTTELDKADIKHEMLITGNLHSLYGSVSLEMEGERFTKRLFELFFFGAGNSHITVSSENALTDTHLENMFSAKENGKHKMEVYTEKELNALLEFMRKNESQVPTNRSLQLEIEQLAKALYKKQFSFIQDNSSTFYSFRRYHELFPQLRYHIPGDSLMMVYQQFPDSYKNTEEGQYLLDILQKQDAIKNKLIASDFNVLNIHQKAVTLKQLRGKYVILDFWATWCGPCMKEMPSLVSITGQYSPDKLAVVSVSLDKDTLAYTKVRKRLPENWEYIFGDHSITDIYGVGAIPVFYLIDPEGKIIFKNNNGLPEAYKTLEKILKEQLKKPS